LAEQTLANLSNITQPLRDCSSDQERERIAMDEAAFTPQQDDLVMTWEMGREE
jgi:hypothetical protein